MSNLSRMLFSLVLLVLLSFASCAAPATRSALGEKPTVVPRTATPQPASAEDAVRQLIRAEGAAVVAQDIAGLMDLWSIDGTITDAKHTPNDPADDAVWRGKDAIRERYVVLVFPGNPQSAGTRDVRVTIEGDHAAATSTTVIGSEVAEGGDSWSFVRHDGRWWIQASLTTWSEDRNPSLGGGVT